MMLVKKEYFLNCISKKPSWNGYYYPGLRIFLNNVSERLGTVRQ